MAVQLIDRSKRAMCGLLVLMLGMVAGLVGSSKGATQNLVMAIVGIAVALGVGIFVIATFYGNLDTSDLDEDAQEAINDSEDMTYTGLSLVPLLIIVIVAGAILKSFD